MESHIGPLASLQAVNLGDIPHKSTVLSRRSTTAHPAFQFITESGTVVANENMGTRADTSCKDIGGIRNTEWTNGLLALSW